MSAIDLFPLSLSLSPFKMKYLASYLLLVAGGKTAPTAADVKGLMASVDVEAEEERLNSLISALEGKNVEEVKKKKNSCSTQLILSIAHC